VIGLAVGGCIAAAACTSTSPSEPSAPLPSSSPTSDIATLGIARAACDGRPATIVGTPSDDVLHGTPRIDVIVGDAGDDVIRAGGGADHICAGAGNDVVDGGPGRDTMSGGAGDDVLRGGRAPDTFVADPGNDRLIGYSRAGGQGTRGAIGDSVTWDRPGMEPLTTAAVVVRLSTGVADSAGTGHDRVTHIESLLGGLGADRFIGDDAHNYLRGGLGVNRLIGRGGRDTLDSGIEDPGTGSGVLRGGAGDDAIYVNGGAYTVSGGRGTDALSTRAGARGQLVAVTGVP
jgi:Ca2+-binding RTX toxin-like protein